MAYNNNKVCVIFGPLITLCLKPVPFILQIPKYLKIFGFIRIDFMYFSVYGFLEIYSVFHKKRWSFSSMSIIIIDKKKLLRQILRYITHDRTDSKTMLIEKVNFYGFQCISRQVFRRAMNLSLNSSCLSMLYIPWSCQGR